MFARGIAEEGSEVKQSAFEEGLHALSSETPARGPNVGYPEAHEH